MEKTHSVVQPGDGKSALFMVLIIVYAVLWEEKEKYGEFATNAQEKPVRIVVSTYMSAYALTSTINKYSTFSKTTSQKYDLPYKPPQAL